MKYFPRTIYCPQCKRKVGVYDGRSTTDQMRKCKKCQKRIIYRIKTGETEVKKLPERNCSSGMTFGI